jgi:hypothetical protein
VAVTGRLGDLGGANIARAAGHVLDVSLHAQRFLQLGRKQPRADVNRPAWCERRYETDRTSGIMRGSLRLAYAGGQQRYRGDDAASERWHVALLWLCWAIIARATLQ